MNIVEFIALILMLAFGVSVVISSIFALINLAQQSILQNNWDSMFATWDFLTVHVDEITNNSYICSHTYHVKQTKLEIPFDKCKAKHKLNEDMLILINLQNETEYMADVYKQKAQFFATPEQRTLKLMVILDIILGLSIFVIILLRFYDIL